MTRIYLIRHAEAEGNLYRIAQGQYDSIITDRGRRQIEALKKRFENIHIDAVYSSDLYRTCATARAVYIPKHLPLHKCKELREICVGDWEQKTWGDIARKTPEELENFTHRLDQWQIPGAETGEQVRDRVLEAIRRIAAANDGKTVAVFSHGCAIRILLATIQGYSIAQLGRTPHGDNTAVSLIEVDGEQMHVVFRDDNSHLAPVAPAGYPVTKRKTALEPGMYFLPTRLPEEQPFLTACIGEDWTDNRTYDARILLSDAADRPTLTAWLGEKPVGILQLNPDKEADQGRGWISLYCMESSYRGRGFGIQLLGQAVQFYRPRNRKTLCLALPKTNEVAGRFFKTYGFQPAESVGGGRQVWVKDIGFHD